jgi:hypothetical protein
MTRNRRYLKVPYIAKYLRVADSLRYLRISAAIVGYLRVVQVV